MINTVVVIFATKIMNLFRNGCVHNVKKLIFLQKSLEFSIIKFIFAASFIRFQFSLLKSLSRGWCILHQPLFGIYIIEFQQVQKLLLPTVVREVKRLKFRKFFPTRPEGAEALSPGRCPGLRASAPSGRAVSMSFWAFSPYINHLRNLS